MQYRFFNYKEDDATFLLNSRYVGLLEPALYRGFDWTQKTADWQLVLDHSVTGFQFTALDTTQGTPLRSSVLTKQGAIIQEDAQVVLTVQPADPAATRIDVVVCVHQHSLTSGGSPAYYRVLTGSPGQPAPSLPDPGKMTIVGYLTVPAGAVNLAAQGVVWVRNTAELAGRPAYQLPYTVAHWTKPQSWTETQRFNGGLGLQYGTGLTQVGTELTLPDATPGTMFYTTTAGGSITKFNVPAGRRGEVFFLEFTAPFTLTPVPGRGVGCFILPNDQPLVLNPRDAVLLYAQGNGEHLLMSVLFGDPARLGQVNRYSRTQQQSKGGAVLETLGAQGYPSYARITLDDAGNAFALAIPTGQGLQIGYMTALPEGTEVKIVTTQASRQGYAGTAGNDAAAPAPDWGFTATGAGYGALTMPGYQQVVLPKPTDGAYVGAQSSAPTTFTFLSLGGAWVLTSVAQALPVHHHDRQQLVFLPVGGGQGYNTVTGGSQQYHSYTTPSSGGKRDYLALHSCVVSVDSYVNFAVTYYRNGVAVMRYAQFINNYQSNRTPIGTQWLYQNVLPGENLEVRFEYTTNGSSGALKVYSSVLSLDGTPSYLV